MTPQQKENLPPDPEALKEIILSLSDENQRLRWMLEKFQRYVFGRKSEKFNPDQMTLEFMTKDSEEKKPALKLNPEKLQSNGHGRKKLPRELPQEVEEHDVDDEDKVCGGCGEKLSRMGEEVTELLEYKPASFFVRKIVRPKYSCRKCGENVVIAEMPLLPIEKGMAGPGLLAHVITSKYADHIPLNRMEGIFRRHDIDISRSTMADWVGSCAGLLKPVYDAMKEDLLKSRMINTDDTPVPVLEKGRKETKKGRAWVYVGDDQHPHVMFDYTPTREMEGPKNFLGGYKGYLQADAYKGYDSLFKSGGMTEVGCWAHARRKFYDALPTNPAGAGTAIAFIKKLYDVEREATGMDAESRKLLRKEKSVLVMSEFREWLDSQEGSVLPKSPLGEAMRYVMSQWAALNVYLEDGDLFIDNNSAERSLRGLVVGRKNWTFAGSDEGGRRAAVIYSLVESCKRHGVDAFSYFRDCLQKILTIKDRRVSELFPQNWKKIRESAEEAPKPVEATA